MPSYDFGYHMNQRAVSPVVGIILMVAITVILAAVIGAFTLNLGNDQEFTSAGVQLDVVRDHPNAPDPNDPYIKIQVIDTGNTERVWVQGDSRDKWLIQDQSCSYETEAGDYLLFPLPQEDGFTIYAEKSDGSLQVIQTESVEARGMSSGGSYLSYCGYGDESRGTLYSEFMDD